MKKHKGQSSSQEGWVGIVYTLSIDMIKSTALAMRRTTQEQNLFNSYLVKQIVPHLTHLNLEDDITQFTGDGWLVMTDKGWKVPALCCFAYIMSRRFESEMSEYTGLELETISKLRLGISSGLDMSVKLLDDTRHWVGDSARRSVRSANCCYPNEILIDYTVIYNYFDIVKTKPLDIEKRKEEFPGIKMEETPDLVIMEEMQYDNWRLLEHPEWLVYTLNQVGKVEEARELASEISSYLSTKEGLSKEAKIERWNKLIYNLDSYQTALNMKEEMESAGVLPNLETYNRLMEKAPSNMLTIRLMDELLERGLSPEHETYNILLKHISTFKEAEKLLLECVERGLNPRVSSYEILIEKAETGYMARKAIDMLKERNLRPSFAMYVKQLRLAGDFDEAKEIMHGMEEAGILPNAVTYALLLKKVSDFDEAEGLLEEMEEKGIPKDLVFE